MTLKKISIFFALLSVSLLIIFSAPKIAKAAIVQVGQTSGPPGTQIVIRGQDFCIHNPGTPISIFWNDHLIYTASSPMFSFLYTIPNADPHTYQITGAAGCPGIPPSIPAYPDYGSASFTVTSSGSSSSPTPASSSNPGSTSSPGASVTINPSIEASIIASASAEAEKAGQEEDKAHSWYKNWKYMLPISILFLALVAGIIFVIVFERHKHKKKKELKQVMPRINKKGKK